MPAEPIGPHMTATPTPTGWRLSDGGGDRIGGVVKTRGGYVFFGGLSAMDSDRLRTIADFLDRVTAARKAGGGA